MQLGIIGLGKMGANMARRLLRHNIQVVGLNRSSDILDELSKNKAFTRSSELDDLINKLESPKVVWIMLPSGQATEDMLLDLGNKLKKGDLIIDGANSNYNDSIRRGELLAEKSIQYMDAGVSGGIWGNDNGYCLMVGGSDSAVAMIQPALEALAPSATQGWAHVGPIGAGHFSKMVHNGIEYGMMQAFAEGFSLLKGKSEFNYNLAQISELWRHSSVVRSWLLDLMAEFLSDDQKLEDVSPFVSDSGEGRWTVEESIQQGVATPVLTMALFSRFTSQDDNHYGNKLLSKMRQAFGGHKVFKK
ncbi:6-phosphogluconate dehydrogenase, decarboxylating [hydrothermal vent metagenome]|uniref:6-phosphogluconate dehydrogenase, decarboxylating n=1 Tax=hydrothermal vent metagenome TaxID=652676 RepID=A0A3B0ZN92_9ZZZZ